MSNEKANKKIKEKNIKTISNESCKRGFKHRYNRNVGVDTGVELNNDNTIKMARTIITSPKGKIFVLDDYMKNNATDYVELTFDDKSYKYTRYIDAEIHVADEIGKE